MEEDDAEDEVASDGCHEGSRALPPVRGGGVMVAILAVAVCGKHETEKRNPEKVQKD